MENLENLVITNSNGKNVTTSLKVAEVFGKRHDSVLRDIDGLSCSEEFRVQHFEETPYTHPQNGQTYRMFEMTKEAEAVLSNRYKYKRYSESLFIYIVKHIGVEGIYKVGKACNIDKRIASMNTASPFGIDVVIAKKVADACSIERRLHAQFSDKRRNGEWFELSEDQLENIISIIEKEALK